MFKPHNPFIYIYIYIYIYTNKTERACGVSACGPDRTNPYSGRTHTRTGVVARHANQGLRRWPYAGKLFIRGVPF